MTRKTVMNQIKIVLQGLQSNHSYRTIEREAHVSHGTVCNIVSRVNQCGIEIGALLEMTDEEIHAAIYPSTPNQRWEPDWNEIYLQKKTVRKSTLLQLYDRYCRGVPAGLESYSYPSFCRLFSEWERKNHHVAPQANVPHEPGEKMEIDYSGDTFDWIDAESVKHKAHIFVAVWPYSSLLFAYATEDEKQKSWIEGCVHALAYAKGCAKLLIVDNAKALVKKADWHEGTIQLALQECCEHYGMRAIACKPRRPKEKNRVEASVGNIQTWILASFELDGRKYFNDIKALNTALQHACDKINAKEFSDGSKDSRRSLFEREELPLLKPLPANPYQTVDYKILMADKAHCIKLSSDSAHRYSVPPAYAKQQVIVRISEEEVRLFDRNTLQELGTHVRCFNQTGQKTHLLLQHLTDVERYLRRTEQDFIRIYISIGIDQKIANEFVMNAFAESDFVGRQRCNAVFSLRRITSPSILNKCLYKALKEGNCSYTYIKKLIEQEEAQLLYQGELNLTGASNPNYVTISHENIRNNYE